MAQVYLRNDKIVRFLCIMDAVGFRSEKLRRNGDLYDIWFSLWVIPFAGQKSCAEMEIYMGEYKRYQLKLITLSPVHIGSGDSINKKEYIYDAGKKEVYILNMPKLFIELCERGLKKDFERYMISGKEPLLNWMESVGFQYSEIKELSEVCLDCRGQLEGMNRPAEIKRFMRDAERNAYVPGSSIKGVIRQCLLAADLMEHNADYLDEDMKKVNGRDQKGLNHAALVLENKRFHTLDLHKTRENAINDMMRYVIVRDSKPVSDKNMTLSRKMDMSKTGASHAVKVLRESIKADTSIEMELVLVPPHKSSGYMITAEEIMHAIQVTYENYYQHYVSKFKMKNTLDRRKNIIYVGGGTGFRTKTGVYELFGEKKGLRVTAEYLDKKFGKHRDDVELGVSPRVLKCTKYNGQLIEMGKCLI